MFYFHPYLGKIPILTNIFQMGSNHQLVYCCSFWAAAQDLYYLHMLLDRWSFGKPIEVSSYCIPLHWGSNEGKGGVAFGESLSWVRVFFWEVFCTMEIHRFQYQTLTDGGENHGNSGAGGCCCSNHVISWWLILPWKRLSLFEICLGGGCSFMERRFSS